MCLTVEAAKRPLRWSRARCRSTSVRFLSSGRRRSRGVCAHWRLAVAPGLPTLAESGLTGYQSGNWYGIVVPAKTPREVITVVRQAAARALADTALNKRLTDLGYLVVGDQPDEFGAFIKAEIATLAKIIQQTGAKAE